MNSPGYNSCRSSPSRIIFGRRSFILFSFDLSSNFIRSQGWTVSRLPLLFLCFFFAKNKTLCVCAQVTLDQTFIWFASGRYIFMKACFLVIEGWLTYKRAQDLLGRRTGRRGNLVKLICVSLQVEVSNNEKSFNAHVLHIMYTVCFPPGISGLPILLCCS